LYAEAGQHDRIEHLPALHARPRLLRIVATAQQPQHALGSAGGRNHQIAFDQRSVGQPHALRSPILHQHFVHRGVQDHRSTAGVVRVFECVAKGRGAADRA
jgi:hypothetical protein